MRLLACRSGRSVAMIGTVALGLLLLIDGRGADGRIPNWDNALESVERTSPATITDGERSTFTYRSTGGWTLTELAIKFSIYPDDEFRDSSDAIFAAGLTGAIHYTGPNNGTVALPNSPGGRSAAGDGVNRAVAISYSAINEKQETQRVTLYRSGVTSLGGAKDAQHFHTFDLSQLDFLFRAVAPQLISIRRDGPNIVRPGQALSYTIQLKPGTDAVSDIILAVDLPTLGRGQQIPDDRDATTVRYTVRPDDPNGPVEVSAILVEDRAGRFTVFFPNGSVEYYEPESLVRNFGAVPPSGPGLSMAYGSPDLVCTITEAQPSVVSLSLDRADPVQLGGVIGLRYVLTPGAYPITSAVVQFRRGDAPDTVVAVAISPAPGNSGTLSIPVTTAAGFRWNGRYAVESVTFYDSRERSVTVDATGGVGYVTDGYAGLRGSTFIFIDPTTGKTSGGYRGPGSSNPIKGLEFALAGENPPQPPIIINSPRSQVVSQNASVTLTVDANGATPLHYAWSGPNLLSVPDAASLTLPSFQANQQGAYFVSVSNADGTALSEPAFVFLPSPGAVAPAIVRQPLDQLVVLGNVLRLEAEATGTAPLAYQWFRDGRLITGETQPVFGVGVFSSYDVGRYQLLVSNAAGSTWSRFASVTAATLPVFTLQPASQIAAPGSTMVFTANATGAPLPTYQWFFQGNAIAGASGPTLVLINASAENLGTYVCAATNAAGTANSNRATLNIVSTPDPGRLVNLSVRSVIGPNRKLTLGFVTGGGAGGGRQNLLIRGVGPALAAFGVADFARDPALVVFQGTASIAANENWGSPAENMRAVVAANTATGAFALTDTGSADAALVLSLPTDAYTVDLRETGASVGTALAEIYDNTSNFTPQSSRLINLSTLAQIDTVAHTLTTGFVVRGTTSKSVLVRAIGPALRAFGVPATLPDPQITLYANRAGKTEVLTGNAGWGGDPQIVAAAARVGAFALADVASKDSAMLLSLPPGNYTAAVASAGGGQGAVLIEIYEDK